ncbi:hypothetical protein ACOSQ4_006587 [Xanthoceras sorbifolium]
MERSPPRGNSAGGVRPVQPVMQENNGSEMGHGVVVCSTETVTGLLPVVVEGQLDSGNVHGPTYGVAVTGGVVTALHGLVVSSPAPLHAQVLSTGNASHGQDLSSPS